MESVQIRIYFWSVFSSIPTEYGEILRISPYSVGIKENTDQILLRIWTLSTNISLKLVKFSAIVIDSHLCNIRNQGLKNSSFPDAAKIASVRPI